MKKKKEYNLKIIIEYGKLLWILLVRYIMDR